MSNTLGNIKITATPGIGGASPPSTTTVLPPYQAISEGIIDIPDATADLTAIPIPFGSVGVGATLVFIKNTNNADIGIKINGAAAVSHRLAPGGVLLHAEPVAAGGTKITAVSVLVEGLQVGAGHVEYLVAGDPV